MTATSAECSSSHLIDNTITGDEDAVASSGEASTAMSGYGPPIDLNDPLIVIDPDSGEARFAK